MYAIDLSDLVFICLFYLSFSCSSFFSSTGYPTYKTERKARARAIWERERGAWETKKKNKGVQYMGLGEAWTGLGWDGMGISGLDLFE